MKATRSSYTRLLIRLRFSLIVLLVLCFQILQNPQTGAAQTSCDTELDSPADDPYGYQWRDNRCEGRYIQKVSSSVLTLASLIQAPADFKPREATALLLSWTMPGPRPVRLRAQSLKYRLYYRMDAKASAAETGFVWPTDILRKLDLGYADLGLIARTQWPLGTREEIVYLPLRIRPQGSAAPDHTESCEMILKPGAEVAEIYLSIASLSTDGAVQSYLLDGRPLAYGYYPPGQPIRIPFGPLPAEGLYRIEVGAVFQNSGTATLNLTLYHAS